MAEDSRALVGGGLALESSSAQVGDSCVSILAPLVWWPGTGGGAARL